VPSGEGMLTTWRLSTLLTKAAWEEAAPYDKRRRRVVAGVPRHKLCSCSVAGGCDRCSVLKERRQVLSGRRGNLGVSLVPKNVRTAAGRVKVAAVDEWGSRSTTTGSWEA